jgi:aspartyl-tRNA(Asn)/glutamyl-tRNA(Gln) amidotransferase subunit A
MPDALPTDPAFLTLAEASSLIAGRRLSSRELTAALVARAEALDGQIFSILRPCFEEAQEAARAADEEMAARGPRGPLHGVPYGLKDIFDVAGLPTTGQSRLYRDAVATGDAEVVRRLRGAGAVLLGKLSTHECAHGGPSFDLFAPPARNPWDTARFTGGSSSGSGAAVAAALMPLALGSDDLDGEGLRPGPPGPRGPRPRRPHKRGEGSA